MPLPLYPLINGNRLQWASAEIVVAGIPYRGVKSANYSDSDDPGKVFGTSRMKIGRTGGRYDCEASIEMFLEEADILLTAVAILGGGGYMDGVFDLHVSYQEIQAGTIITDNVIGCRIKKVDDTHQEGTEALTRKFDLDPMYIIRNGKFPLNPIAMLK